MGVILCVPKSNVYIGVQRKNDKNCHCPNSYGSTCIKLSFNSCLKNVCSKPTMFGNLLLSVVMLMVFFCGNLKTKNSSNPV